MRGCLSPSGIFFGGEGKVRGVDFSLNDVFQAFKDFLPLNQKYFFSGFIEFLLSRIVFFNGLFGTFLNLPESLFF